MPIPTEPIGSVPRPPALQTGLIEFADGRIDQETLDGLAEEALTDTIKRFEATGSTVIIDGEQENQVSQRIRSTA